MQKLQTEKRYTVLDRVLNELQSDFSAYYSDEHETRRTIGNVYDEFGYLMDPHTAVGMAAADQYLNEIWPQRQTVILSTASPYKFTPVEMEVLGLTPTGSPFDDMRAIMEKTGAAIPERLLELENAQERFSDSVTKDKVTEYVLDFIGKGKRQ